MFPTIYLLRSGALQVELGPYFLANRYSEIYDNDTYKSTIQQKNFCLPKGVWKKLLEEGSKHRKQFGAVLKQITVKDKVEGFLSYFDTILKRKSNYISSYPSRASFTYGNPQKRDYHT